MRTKKISLICFSVIMVFCAFFCVLNTANVKGDGEPYIYMHDGADLKVSDGKNGIRFILRSTSEQYAAILEEENDSIEFGILIAPKDYNETKPLNKTNVFGVDGDACYDWAEWDETNERWVYSGNKTRIIRFATGALTQDGESGAITGGYHLYGRIYDILDGTDAEKSYTNNLDKEFIAVGYLMREKGGVVTYEFTEAVDNSRSLAYLAQKASEDPENEPYMETINGYIDKVSVIPTDYTVNVVNPDTEEVIYSMSETTTINASISSASIISSIESEGFLADNFATQKAYANDKTVLNLTGYTLTDNTSTTDVLVDKSKGKVVSGITGTISAVKDSSNNLLAYDDVADSFAMSGITRGANNLYLLIDGAYYKVSALVADKTISNASEFVSVMGAITANSTDYIALANDITFSGSETYVRANRFRGTLDGRGYTVDGLDLTKHGLSNSNYAMINGGDFTMKNIAFVNLNMATVNGTRVHLCGNASWGVTIENCYLELLGGNVGLAWNHSDTFTIKDTVIVRNTASTVNALYKTETATTRVEDFYLVANDSALLWDGYVNNDTHLTGTVTRNSSKATILAAINASETASEQLKTFANRYFEHVVAEQNLVQKSTTSSFLETLDIDGETIASVSCGGVDLSYSAGTFNTSGLTHGEQTFRIVTTTGKVYIVNAIVADKTISNASEFVSVMGAITAGSTDYIALANDIVFSGSETYAMANRFSGTLDGRGYTVNGLDLTKHGRSGSWYAMINGGNFTMKNIAFVNLNMATVNSTRVHLCGNTSWGVTIENCYLELLGNSVGLAWNHSDTFTIKDTVIVRNTASTVNALYNTETATTRVEDFYLVANDSALLWGSYVNNDTHLTGTVTRNSSKAAILAAINASETASDQLKAFANAYLVD